MGTLASELRPIAADLSRRPRVYADANLPAGLVESLRHRLGWDVLFVVEHDDLRRAPDVTHYHRALELGRTLITLDRDFFDNRRFPPDLSPGVVVCWAPDERGLLRLLRDLDQSVFRPAPAADLPLRGRKLELMPTP
jgi:hypothetical protein